MGERETKNNIFDFQVAWNQKEKIRKKRKTKERENRGDQRKERERGGERRQRAIPPPPKALTMEAVRISKETM